MVLHAHLSQAAVDARLDGSGDGLVVRVEELGPMLLETFLALTGRADLDLKPVVDLNAGRSVNQWRLVDGSGTHVLDPGADQQYLTARSDVVNP